MQSRRFKFRGIIMTKIPVAGLELTVYGLDEYVPQTPVAVMFALHGRLEKKASIQHVAEALCSLNEKSSGKRHLIVVAFDQPNHGTRQLHRLSNFAWKEGRHANPTHAQDMWSFFYSSAQTISLLIDILESYLFGPLPRSVVEAWGVIGFSMGGHATYMAAAMDPRISVAIPVVGTANFLGLMEQRVVGLGLSKSDCLPQPFVDMVSQKVDHLEQKVKSTKLLMINAELDKTVLASANYGFVEKVRRTHEGVEDKDWRFVVVPNVGHKWCPEMIDLSVGWVERWLLSSTRAKL